MVAEQVRLRELHARRIERFEDAMRVVIGPRRDVDKDQTFRDCGGQSLKIKALVFAQLAEKESVGRSDTVLGSAYGPVVNASKEVLAVSLSWQETVAAQITGPAIDQVDLVVVVLHLRVADLPNIA